MPTAEDFEEIDHRFVREDIFSPSWTPDPMPSSAWRGIVQDGEYLVPDPQPTTAGEPTVYGAWDLVYDSVEGDFEDVGAPIRQGRLRITGLIQKGAMMGHLRQFFKAAKRRVGNATSDGPLGFCLQETKLVPLGNHGPWRLQMIEIPFVGPG